jgi:hypothetical protein
MATTTNLEETKQHYEQQSVPALLTFRPDIYMHIFMKNCQDGNCTSQSPCSTCEFKYKRIELLLPILPPMQWVVPPLVYSLINPHHHKCFTGVCTGEMFVIMFFAFEWFSSYLRETDGSDLQASFPELFSPELEDKRLAIQEKRKLASMLFETYRFTFQNQMDLILKKKNSIPLTNYLLTTLFERVILAGFAIMDHVNSEKRVENPHNRINDYIRQKMSTNLYEWTMIRCPLDDPALWKQQIEIWESMRPPVSIQIVEEEEEKGTKNILSGETVTTTTENSRKRRIIQ